MYSMNFESFGRSIRTQGKATEVLEEIPMLLFLSKDKNKN